jgi:arylsulfatase A-like enzyme
VSTLDVLPTLTTLVDVPPHPAFQGVSLLDEPESDRPIFMNIQGMKSHDAVVCGDYKLIVDRSTRKQRLFHLGEDPGETRDISLRRPNVARALRSLLSAQMRAQLSYHSRESSERQKRFAPRFASCPATTTEPKNGAIADGALSARTDVTDLSGF